MIGDIHASKRRRKHRVASPARQTLSRRVRAIAMRWGASLDRAF